MKIYQWRELKWLPVHLWKWSSCGVSSCSKTADAVNTTSVLCVWVCSFTQRHTEHLVFQYQCYCALIFADTTVVPLIDRTVLLLIYSSKIRQMLWHFALYYKFYTLWLDNVILSTFVHHGNHIYSYQLPIFYLSCCSAFKGLLRYEECIWC